jgi:hypothetical protein
MPPAAHGRAAAAAATAAVPLACLTPERTVVCCVFSEPKDRIANGGGCLVGAVASRGSTQLLAALRSRSRSTTATLQ